MSRMYYVCAEDHNGEDQSQFVCANSVIEAFEIFHTNHESELDDYQVMRIFEPPTDTTKIGVIGWQDLTKVILK